MPDAAIALSPAVAARREDLLAEMSAGDTQSFPVVVCAPGAGAVVADRFPVAAPFVGVLADLGTLIVGTDTVDTLVRVHAVLQEVVLVAGQAAQSVARH